MSKLKPSSIAFEKRYSDGSGVEFGVAIEGERIRFDSIGDVSFPVQELDWIIACLQRIKEEFADEGESAHG